MAPEPLDQPAHAGLIDSLHERGVITAEARARSLVWLREEVAWRAWAGNLLLVFGVLLVLAGIVCFAAANWEYIGALAKFAGLEALLFGCAVGAWFAGLDRLGGKVLLAAAAVLAGAMLLLIGVEYPSSAEAYELFTLWAALIAGWVFVSRCSVTWLFWLALLNTALISFWKVKPDWFLWFPLSGANSSASLCIGLALLNGLPLAARELAARRGVEWLAGRESRLLPLLVVLGALFIPTAWLIIEFERRNTVLMVAGALNLACLAAGLSLYKRVLPDIGALTLCVLSLCVLICIVIGRVLLETYHGGNDAFYFLAFAILILLVFGVAVVWLKSAHRVMQGETHAAGE